MWTSGRQLALALCVALATFAPAATLAAADGGSAWIAGMNAVGDDTFVGFIDAPQPGVTIARNSTVILRGWVVDQSAQGWTGIDDVQIYLGLPDQGGALVTRASIGQRRDDVAAAFGNPFWAGSGFSASFSQSSLAVGSNVLTVYAHTPDRGWWYKQVEVHVEPLPALPYADDPLLIVREVVPSLTVDQTTQNMTLRGYAIDRNLPLDKVLGIGGTGVSQVQFYLDGPRQSGIFLGNADFGRVNREATGFGSRFLQSGWELTVHPGEFSVDKHEFFIYAVSAYTLLDALIVLPFTVQ
ncbi:MAG TPA: hypothetical protein VKV73_33770 [Chloroflexota bacterium]|nr:hypothetical protein [Chloroflexota bacterium]